MIADKVEEINATLALKLMEENKVHTYVDGLII